MDAHYILGLFFQRIETKPANEELHRQWRKLALNQYTIIKNAYLQGQRATYFPGLDEEYIEALIASAESKMYSRLVVPGGGNIIKPAFN